MKVCECKCECIFVIRFNIWLLFFCILKFSFCLKFHSEDCIFLWNPKIKNSITITLLKMKLPSISLFGYCFRLDQKKFAHMETSPLKVYKLKKVGFMLSVYWLWTGMELICARYAVNQARSLLLSQGFSDN